jgi:hypothetical protein
MHLTRFLRTQQQSLAHLIDHYAKYPPTGLTMKRIVEFGKCIYFMLKDFFFLLFFFNK